VRDIRAAIKPQLLPTPPELKLYLPPQFREGAEEQRGVVDVDLGKEGFGADDGNGEGGMEGEGNGEDSMVGATRWQKEAARKKKELMSEEKQKPMGGSDEGATPGNKDDGKAKEGAKVEEKPLSRAERRRKIKEEILATGEGEGFKGYKRRMW
jgi:hypothetical protein